MHAGAIACGVTVEELRWRAAPPAASNAELRGGTGGSGFVVGGGTVVGLAWDEARGGLTGAAAPPALGEGEPRGPAAPLPPMIWVPVAASEAVAGCQLSLCRVRGEDGQEEAVVEVELPAAQGRSEAAIWEARDPVLLVGI